ncbi:MAG: hypothetical protein ACP5VS_08740 [Desulfomonilaceae bacterium]
MIHPRYFTSAEHANAENCTLAELDNAAGPTHLSGVTFGLSRPEKKCTGEAEQ